MHNSKMVNVKIEVNKFYMRNLSIFKFAINKHLIAIFKSYVITSTAFVYTLLQMPKIMDKSQTIRK